MVGLLATLSCTSYFSKPAIHRIHIELTMLSSHVKFNIITVSFIFSEIRYYKIPL